MQYSEQNLVKTNLLINEFMPDRTGRVQNQIGGYLRGLIEAGDLGSGVRLPSTQSMAERWDTPVATVHQALTPLVKEGLLTRVPRRGTFVRDVSARLACVGLYYYHDLLDNQEYAYLRSLDAVFHNMLGAAGVQMRMWVDNRSKKERCSEPLPDLLRACREREVQGVIATGGGDVGWLQNLPVAVTVESHNNIPGAVTFDELHFLTLALQKVARQGCRSVGFICAHEMDATYPEVATPHYVHYYNRFFELAAKLNLEVREDWIRVPKAGELKDTSFERFGYDGCCTILDVGEQPDALIVYTDVMARGAVMALLQHQVSIPEKLKLVLHKNHGIDFVCPMPATFLESSPMKIAQALVAGIRKQLAGEPCPPVKLQYRMVQPVSDADRIESAAANS